MKRLIVITVGVAALAVGVLVAWYSVRQERQFQRLIVAGDTAVVQDQTYAAIEAFSGALALKRDSMLAHLKRGDAYRRRGELTRAQEDLERAIALAPAAPQPLEALGDVHLALGRADRAIDAYGRFITLDDRSARVFYKLALAHYREADPATAIRLLTQALSIDARLAEAEHLLGLCYRESGQPAEAVRAMLRAIEINPAFSAAREALAGLYSERGRYREQLQQLEALAALAPDTPDRLVTLGLAYATLGQTDAAVLTLGRAADRFPDDAMVYVALGRVWLDDAELRNDRVALGKAMEALEARATSPSASSEAQALYGRALLMAGRVETAEQLLTLAASRPPVDAGTFRYLAEARRRLGRDAASAEALARYHALMYDGPVLPDRADPEDRRQGS